MPLGSRMGLGVDPAPFLAPTPEGSVEEAPREGARDGTLDTGAEADTASDCWPAECVEDAGRDTWLSSSRAVPGGSRTAAAGEPLRRLQQSTASWWMGSSRTSWTRVLSLSRRGEPTTLTWLVCGTAGQVKASNDLQGEDVNPRPPPLRRVWPWPHLLAAAPLLFISAASFMAFSHVFMSSWVSALK